MAQTFSKDERLCSGIAIERLVSSGRYCCAGVFRCRWRRRDFENDAAAEAAALPSRLMISVPKKLFKRAVKRNLLKRRIRESYRRLKGEINGGPYDILLIYSTKEIMDYGRIYADVEAILKQLH